MHAPLRRTLDSWLAEARPPAPAHLGALEALADWLAAREAAGEAAPVSFICTHNSRRSHMACLWFWAASVHQGLASARCFSGGTEATAWNPRAVAALRAQGFLVEDTGEEVEPGVSNRRYRVRLDADGPALDVFSKVFDHPANPDKGFAAVLVCDSAAEACPFVPGAALRLPLSFVDPKESDGTPAESATYLARSEEIGRTMAWLAAAVRRRS